MKRRETNFKEEGWGLGSATGERREKGVKADEMKRKIQKEDLVVERGERRGQRAGERLWEREW